MWFTSSSSIRMFEVSYEVKEMTEHNKYSKSIWKQFKFKKWDPEELR